MTTYTLVYPPAHNGTYVKSTTTYDATNFWPYFATDPAKSLTGTSAGNSWAASVTKTNQRFHVDLGAATIIRRVYYENFHNAGLSTTSGAKNFIMQGSNEATAFAQLTYGTDTDWTQLTTSVSLFDQHSAVDAVDPKYFLVTNTVAYRYYAFKIADNYAGGYVGLRRIVLMTEDGYGGVSFISRPIFF